MADLENISETLSGLNVMEVAELVKMLEDKLCFIGHSHKPVVFEANAGVDWFLEDKITIERDAKYIINIGSVGQPRDGNPKASFAVYDSDAGVVEIKRLSYDIEKAQKKILEAGLPSILAERLSIGK